MTSGDLNIDLTQKKVVYKSCKSFNELSNALAVCRYDSCFSSSDEGQKGPRPIQSLSEPARNTVKRLNDIW